VNGALGWGKTRSDQYNIKRTSPGERRGEKRLCVALLAVLDVNVTKKGLKGEKNKVTLRGEGGVGGFLVWLPCV